MSIHSYEIPTPDAPKDFGPTSRRLLVASSAAGVIGLVAAVVLGFLADHALRRFLFSYLTALATFLAIPLGALAFVLLQHLTRAGWSVNVRRVAESMAMTLPVLGVLTIPILVSIGMQKGTLYRWALPMSAAQTTVHGAGHAQPVEPGLTRGTTGGLHTDAESATSGKAGEHPLVLDELTLKKRAWLNPWFAIVRVILYFAIWTIIARYYWKHSTAQDRDGDVEHTALMQKYAGISILVLGATATFASFDLLMSLDPHWFSTIYGVYYISTALVGFFAAIIVAIALLRRSGYLQVVGIDHYHDLGKYLFGFVFFWGYIAFSQYMLIWYANIPETTEWLGRHGATTVVDMFYTSEGQMNAIPDGGAQWKGVALALLLGNLLIPFAGLMSRHVKRRVGVLTFWAVWLLVFHYIDIYWLVMPEMRIGFVPRLVDLACVVGVGGVVIAAWAKIAGTHRLRPLHDPRMDESLAFTNI